MDFMGGEMTRLPPGFRFQPTDEELLFQYLRCKIFSLPLPASVIPEVHFSKLDPWELPDSAKEEKYVFTKKGAKYMNKNQNHRRTNNGYWKVINGSEKHIFPSSNLNLGNMMMMMKGVKKTLAYHFSNNAPTDWLMHEYSLANMNYNATSKGEDWVICHVFLNKQIMEEYDGAIMLDYSSISSRNPCLTSCSSSSSSSNFVAEEVSSNYESQSDEESSYYL
ncbi:NAC domain-containing protein 83 [Bienertia sinuspersici]